MLGSIDCMHLEWIKCPKALQGQFKQMFTKYLTIIFEAIADEQLWFWHAFLGVPGANNDINVLNDSPAFDDLLMDKAPEVPFQVNGSTFGKGYYLADEIYPQWSTFVKAFSIARDLKSQKFKEFKRVQEETLNELLVSYKVGGESYNNRHDHITLTRLRIMYCCIILHNMILEDQKFDVSEYTHMYASLVNNLQRTWIERSERQRIRNKELQVKNVHEDLRQGLAEHVSRNNQDF